MKRYRNNRKFNISNAEIDFVLYELNQAWEAYEKGIGPKPKPRKPSDAPRMGILLPNGGATIESMFTVSGTVHQRQAPSKDDPRLIWFTPLDPANGCYQLNMRVGNPYRILPINIQIDQIPPPETLITSVCIERDADGNWNLVLESEDTEQPKASTDSSSASKKDIKEP